MFEFESEKK